METCGRVCVAASAADITAGAWGSPAAQWPRSPPAQPSSVILSSRRCPPAPCPQGGGGAQPPGSPGPSRPALTAGPADAQAAGSRRHVVDIPEGLETPETLEGAPPSFKSSETGATRNPYASFSLPPHSEEAPRAAGRLGKFGPVPPSGLGAVNRWGIPLFLGLRGGGESANGWGNSSQQGSGWGSGGATGQAQGQWGGGPGRSPAGTGGSPSQGTGLKPQAPPNTASSQQQSGGSPATQTNGQSGNAPNQQQGTPGQSSTPNQAPSGNGQGNGGNNGSWAAAAGKGLSPSGPGNGVAPGSGDAQKRHMEQQLQTIREALLSSEGWGGDNVNQETNWDLPSSPEPGKDASGAAGAAPHWKVVVNNGCELWENNLRNGGAPPAKAPQTPWGHTPATNYGGTWGEDDDAQDSSNVWTGVPPAGAPPQWAGNAPNPPNMWGTGPPKKNPEWSGGGGGNPHAWGEPGPQRPAVDNPVMEFGPPKPAPHVPAHAGSHPGGPPSGQHPPHTGPHAGPHAGPHGGPHPGPHAGPHGPHPGQHPGPHPGPHPSSHAGPHPGSHAGPHVGPHSGPHPGSHPGPHPGHPQIPQPGPHGGPHGGPNPHAGPNGPAQWNGSKDMPMPPPQQPTGWEPPSPPSIRRDDGTQHWGNPNNQGNVSRWREMNPPNMMPRPGLPSAQPQGRMPGPHGPMPPGIKPERMWGQHG